MKSEELILANMYGKIGAYRAGFRKNEKLKEHIRMLDWVIDESPTVRDIDRIVEDYDGDESCPARDPVCDGRCDGTIGHEGEHYTTDLVNGVFKEFRWSQ